MRPESYREQVPEKRCVGIVELVGGEGGPGGNYRSQAIARKWQKIKAEGDAERAARQTRTSRGY